MSTSHTPGPWKAVFSEVPDIAPANCVAKIHQHLAIFSNYKVSDPRVWRADARLIAKAPELLRALKEAVCWIPDGSRMTPEQRGAKCETAYEVEEMIRALLAEIEGA